MKVTICLIATKKYKQFVEPLVRSIDNYFLLRHEVEVVLFTDEISPFEGIGRIKVTQDLIVSYGFPEATLYRYAIITSREYNCDYLYYLDVDYLIVSEVDESIFGNIVAVYHPGFYNGGGSWCTDVRSNAYTYPGNRKKYYAGGTQGGRYEYYYPTMQRLKREIENDEKRGVKAEWNDEAHWNKYLSELNEFTALDPSYCMVQQEHLQREWGVDHLPKIILALEKNHEEIRS